MSCLQRSKRSDLTIGFLVANRQFERGSERASSTAEQPEDVVHALFEFDLDGFCHRNEAFVPISVDCADFICEYIFLNGNGRNFGIRCSKVVKTKALFSS